jgi:hypothetical protein
MPVALTGSPLKLARYSALNGVSPAGAAELASGMTTRASIQKHARASHAVVAPGGIPDGKVWDRKYHDSHERARASHAAVEPGGIPDGKVWGRKYHDSHERARASHAVVAPGGIPDGKVWGRKYHDSPIIIRFSDFIL